MYDLPMPRTGLSPETVSKKAVQATLGLVRTHGADKLRMTDVARALGLSHAALYSHFRNKAALFDAALTDWLTRIEAGAATVLAVEPPEGPGDRDAARLMQWFDSFYHVKRQALLADPALFHALETAMLGRSPVTRAHVERLIAQVEALLRPLDGNLPPRAALLLFEATMPFHHPVLLEKDPDEDRSDRLRLILEAILRGWGVAV